MKKTLLLLATAMLSISSAFAQWTEPEMPTTGSDLVSGHKYQIKNVAAEEENVEGTFLAGGVAWYSWATSTVLLPQESALTFTLDETESGWTIRRTTDNKYTFISGNSPKGLTDTGEMHVDQGSQAADLHFFNFKKVGNYYRIFPAEANTAFNIRVYDDEGEPMLFWGWKTNNADGEDETYGAYPTAVYATVSPEAGFGCDWELVDLSVYDARMTLFNLQDQAADFNVDLSAAGNVYNNPQATLEELQQAIKDVEAAIRAAKVEELLAGAAADDPRDATELLNNPDFSAGNINGWVCTFVSGTNAQNIGYQKASYTGKDWYDEETGDGGTANFNQFIEAWSPNTDQYKFDGRTYATIGDGKLYQLISGLPAGKYKLSADVNAVQQHDASVNPVVGVQLYATSGEFDAHMDMATGNGIPEHFILTFIHQGGDIEMGLRTQSTTANWIGADNFTLRYYGPVDKNPYLIVLEDLIASCEAKYDDPKAEATIVEAYNEALAEAKAASDEQAYIDAKDKLEAAANALAKSVALYEVFAKNLENVEDRMAELDGTDWSDLAGELSDFYYGELQEAYENGTYTEEQINELAQKIEDMISNYVSENLKAGDDVTILLKNPGFTSDFSGWTSTGAGVVWQANHGNGENLLEVAVERPADNDGLAERWHDTFTISQVIKNLPAGLYTLTCQGFNRHDDGVNDKFAELYAVLPDGTEQFSHFADINDYATAEMLYENEEGDEHWRSDAINDDGMYIPNSMTGSAWHFMNKSDGENYDYESKFNIVLKEAGDLTVGVRCNDGHQWVIFDNFRIVYKGSEGVYTEPILDLQEIAMGYTKNTTEPMTIEIEDAIAESQKALEDGSDEACLAAMEALQNVITRAEENIELKNGMQPYYDKLNGETADQVGELENDEMTNTWEELIEVIDGQLYLEYTNEQMKEYGEKVDAFVKEVSDALFAKQQEEKYQEIAAAVADATDEDPAFLTDYLVNPDLENEGSTRGQDPEGWTLDLTQYTNRGYQDNKEYLGEAIELNGEEYIPSCNHFIEVWKSGGEPIFGDIYQKIMLPAGTYMLSADVITTNGEQIEGCYLYAGESHMVVRSDVANTPKHYELIFKVAEDRTVVQLGINCSATSNASWLGADNFTLTAFGPNSQISENGEENAIASISSDKAQAVYSLTGVRMDKALKPGLYIVNGKKIVVK